MSQFFKCGLLFWLLGFHTQAQTPPDVLRYNVDFVGAWVPFDASSDPTKPSIMLSILALIEQQSNIKIAIEHYPIKRSVKELYDGNLDFDFVNPQWLSQDDSHLFVFSQPLFQVTEYFIGLPEVMRHYQTKEQIYGSLVGTVAGYYYFDDDEFQRADFRSESEVMLGLAKQRFNIAIMEKYAAQYWAYQHKVGITFGPVHTQGDIVIRLRIPLKHLLPRINHAIEVLKKTNKFQHIIEQQVNEMLSH